mmetsp:Transcript_21095/g.59347  ORF Transcript_21095/g.59347 Transcript_21095/m.59347 type:complete len:489 (+) Transcript_21095:185-1651(+)|eukprot:CAMPEP_0119121506 /NCGR_PEP_ID=MMETSP1310-20130426/2105_1 /TAXON_ID=464262 /ORGANISM="Genus nov. species nov., Strain RCC2339" /LENGTH=488 /DNA_ID=CAMNT_0007111073 /DNA_START=178 /DNA_END=1644 /DNA_ORIENTATION=+
MRGRRGRQGGGDFAKQQKQIESNAARLAKLDAEKASNKVKPVTRKEYPKVLQDYEKLERMIWEAESEDPEARRTVLQKRYNEVSAALRKKKADHSSKAKELSKAEKHDKELNRMLPAMRKIKARIGKDGIADARAKAAEEIENIQDELKEIDAEVAVIKDQRASLKRELMEFKSRTDELHSLRAAQEALLIRLFTGRSGDDEENDLEEGLQNLMDRKHKIAETKTRFDSGEMHLTSALGGLQEGMRLLNAALAANTVDIIGNRPGPGRGAGLGPRGNQPLMNVAQANQIRRCNQVLSEAKMSLLQAKQYIPTLPHITDAQISNMSVFLNILVDNIVTDIVQRRKIMKNMEQLAGITDSVKYALRWTQEVIRKIDKDFDKTEKAYFDQKRSLTDKRRKLILELIAKEKEAAKGKEELAKNGSPSAPFDDEVEDEIDIIVFPDAFAKRSYSAIGGWSSAHTARMTEKGYDPTRGAAVPIPDDSDLYGMQL